MARLKLLKFSFNTLKVFDKQKATKFINLIIFLSIFALSASIISMVYENKIDHLDNKIINEEINIIIYENQIQTTPIIIKNIEDVFYDNFRLDDYLKLLELWNDRDKSIAPARNTIYKPYFGYEATASYANEQMKQSMSDAILVSNNVNDILEIEEFNKLFVKIDNEIRDIKRSEQIIRNNWQLNQREEFESKNIELGKDKEVYYKKYLSLNQRLIQVLQDQLNFFTNFNIKYFSRKKNETQKTINYLESDLKKFSNQESLIILIAFILQLVIFVSVQYFEVTTEVTSAKKTKKKQ